MAMTHLRQRMIEDMQLRGFSLKTQEATPEAGTPTGGSL
jgi:hypothetical protein